MLLNQNGYFTMQDSQRPSMAMEFDIRDIRGMAYGDFGSNMIRPGSDFRPLLPATGTAAVREPALFRN